MPTATAPPTAKAAPPAKRAARKRSTTTTKAPAGPTAKPLGPEGQQFHDAVVAEYQLSVAELRTLEDVCREIDLIERLQVALESAELLVRGSMGQPVASPFVQEIRQHRATLDRLIKSLNLPDPEGAAATDADRSTSARARALKRWGTGGA